MIFSIWSSFEIFWIIVLIYTLAQLCTGNVRNWIWTKDAVTSPNVVCTAGALRIAHATSAAKCGDLSTREVGCTAFTYAKDLVPNCYMLLATPVLTDGCIATTNAQHFVKKRFSCPPKDGLYHKYLLDDHTIATYRIVRTTVNMQTASNNCAASGGVLAKVSSLAKLALIRRIIQTCPDFSGSHYWIDGNDNQNVDGQWRWSDGELVNMNSSFWDAGEPDDGWHCLAIDNRYEIKFNDGWCGYTFGFICQRN